MILKNVRVTSIGLDNGRMDVLWDFIDPDTSLTHEVWVERSGSESGPFEILAKTYNSVSYTDFSANQIHGFNLNFYRLRAVPRDDLTKTDELTKGETFEAPTDVIAAEIRRRTNLLHKEFVGRPVLYYRSRHQGRRCTECWGALEQQRVKSKCEACFDTGWMLGYFNPIFFYIKIAEGDIGVQHNSETDEVLMRSAVSHITGDIEVVIGDLIVEKENVRWLVGSFGHSEKLRSRVSQIVNLHRILESDVKFKVPIPEPGIFESQALSREYTRPYTLEPSPGVHL